MVLLKKSPLADSPFVLNFKRIRSLRLKLGLSMEDAAKLAKLAGRQSWYNVESGRKANITISTLYAIARALQVHPRYLLK